MGAESGYNNVFYHGGLDPVTGAVTGQWDSENNRLSFGAEHMFDQTVSAGALDVAFWNGIKLNSWVGLFTYLRAAPGDDGFGIFLPASGSSNISNWSELPVPAALLSSTSRGGYQSPAPTRYYQSNVLYFGFDDQRIHPDDNHDDFLVRATILEVQSPVPEPAAWAMMIIGFGAVGAVLRGQGRRRMAALA